MAVGVIEGEAVLVTVSVCVAVAVGVIEGEAVLVTVPVWVTVAVTVPVSVALPVVVSDCVAVPDGVKEGVVVPVRVPVSVLLSLDVPLCVPQLATPPVGSDKHTPTGPLTGPGRVVTVGVALSLGSAPTVAASRSTNIAVTATPSCRHVCHPITVY